MIQTGTVSKVKIQDVISNQLPNYIRDESPKTIDFLKQYYISQEYQSGVTDLSDNLSKYLDFNSLTPEVIVDSSTTVGVTTVGAGIVTVTSTKGFPNQYGLLKIDDEIITYTGITTNTFTGCVRGFSGITSYHSDTNKEDLIFSSSSAAEHEGSSAVQNLSSLFLKEFYKKFKTTFLPGLEETNFQSKLDVGTFIGEARSLYQTKGTEESFRILFNVLYGIEPKVLNLEERLVKPSFANYVRRRVCVGELLSGDSGNIKKLTGQTLFRSDLDSNINASISEIEPFQRVDSGLSGITTYQKISLFVGYDENTDVAGDFVVVPNSKSMENVSAGASVITVDSTIGFGTTGTILSNNNIITYTSKTVNQFLGCTATNTNSFNDPIVAIENIRSDISYFGFEDGDTDKKVSLRLTGVLSDFEQTEKVDVEEGEIISVKGIGDKVENPENGVEKSYKEIFANSWIYNTSSTYFVDGLDGSSLILPSVSDRSSLKVGDAVQIVDRDSNVVLVDNAVVVAVTNEIVNEIERTKLDLTNTSNFNFETSRNYKVRKKLNKAKSSGTPLEFGNDILLSDVQNVYFKDNDSYVASNSLPSNLISVDNVSSNFSKEINISINDKSFDLSKVSGDPPVPVQPDGAILGGKIDIDIFSNIEFANNHQFKTGDRIFYSSTNGDNLVGLNTGSYYVKKISESNIELYGSPGSIDDGEKLTFSRSSNDGIHNIVLFSQRSSTIGAQKLIKRFPLEQNIYDGGSDSTPIGETGMLINGVEISNYKSNEKVFFGPLTKVDVLNGGSNFDAINLPKISVSTGIGTTALVQPVISGKVKDIFVDPQNFDIDRIISIGVTGGNGSGCVLEPIISTRFREEFFDARPSTNLGGLTTSTGSGIGLIFFNADHKFIQGEPIIYDSGFNSSIKIGSGSSTLVNNATYFPEVINSRNIRLYETLDNLSSGINTISFANSNETAQGTHSFKVGLRKTLTDVKVIDEGDGYTNRKLIVKTSGISTAFNKINFVNHGFNSGDLIEYAHEGNTISGLNIGKKYYILKVDSNSFRLADAGFDGKTTSNFDRGNFVILNSIGSGNQIFKYPDIKAFAEFSSVGISSIDGVPVSIELTPKVRGSIIQSYLYESGTGYGSSIINNHKKPIVSVKNGKNAVLKPVIINGRITDVNIDFGGQEYYSAPDLEVVDPTGAGAGAKLRPVIGINTNRNDSVITDVIIVNAGIGYSTDTGINVKTAGHSAFFDSEVRSLTLNNHDTEASKEYQQLRDSTRNKLKYSVTGYSTSLFGDYAGNSDTQSNIIGWAYDGNPIYGPFGTNDPEDTTKPYVRLKSGYTKDSSGIEDRPDTNTFKEGEFLEDYKFNSLQSDLDIHNGRFEKTKEFPNGVYAYHATVNDLNEPTFPYFIGNSFRSKIIKDNFIDSDQTTFDFNLSGLLRNTFPYKVSDEFANNDFLVETNEIQTQKIEIESISSGSVTDFDIIESGQNYKVGEPLTFDDDNDGNYFSSVISDVEGKKVETIETEITEINDAVLLWSEENITVITPENHDFETGDVVKVSGISTDISVLNNSFSVGVTTFTTNTISTISASPFAGLSTEIFVSNIPTSVTIGSSIGIGTETLKILNIYGNENILTVQRDSDSSQETIHPAGSVVNYLPDKFTIFKSIPFFNSKINRKVFFNPLETVGVGTADGEELSRTFDFGGKQITRNLPIKQIFINNHSFETNQKLKFSTPTGVVPERLLVSADNGANNFTLPETVFAVSKDINHIGIKTQISSPEVFITDVSNVSSNVGEALRGKYQFETVFDSVTSKVESIKSTVTTDVSHNLSTGDKISLKVEPNLSVGIGTSTGVRVVRDTVSGSILINPIGFNSTGINTTSNSINIIEHGLQTGDKVKYSSNLLPEGLEIKNYYVYRVDDNNIKLSETSIDVRKPIPSIVGVASTGGSSQTISLINPSLTSIKNNNLVFDLSDSTLNGYEFKLYNDNKFQNNFVSDGQSSIFSISTSGSPGSSEAKLTIGYGTSIPNVLFYNLEKAGSISTVDTDVKDYSKISFLDSVYNGDYNIKVTGLSTFTFFVKDIPEKISYGSTETSSLIYTTNSKNTEGAISKIRLTSTGSNYKKLPNFVGIGGTTQGTGAVIIAKSDTIGNVEKVRIINEGFEYSSDKTLEPESLIASNINIVNTNTLGIVSVTDGGADYINAPDIIIINDNTGEEIKSGFLEPIMLENSILSVDIVEIPNGLPSSGVVLRAINNTNGINITNVESNTGSSYTCRIPTPPNGFPVNPFKVNDRVFVEGIVGVGTTGTANPNTESGFNSSDYGFKLLKVSKYEEDVNGQDEVTIDLSEFSTVDNPVKTGIAQTVPTSFANLINASDYPTFFLTQEQSDFVKGERVNVVRNGFDIPGNFEIVRVTIGKLKILNAEKLKVGDILTGQVSGVQCEISKITNNTGRLKTDFSILKNLGWNDNIGKLSEDFQVIPDNDYYQNMSYSIQSPIEWDDLKTPVNNILHTSGMKNFADTGITSSTSATVGVTSGLSIIRDLFSEKRVDEIKNIDLVVDTDISDGNGRFILFNDIRLSDYIECKTNDVLIMDDISNEFSNLQGNPDNFIDLFEFPISAQTEVFNNLLIVTKSNTSLFNKIEISDLILLGDDNDNFLIQKSNLNNAGVDLQNDETDNFVGYSLNENTSTGITNLRFTPSTSPDPTNNVDYDLKIASSQFNTNSVGVGTSSIGPVNLTSRIQFCPAGITTTIATFPVSNFESVYAMIHVVNNFDLESNLVETFISHSSTDTFLSEKYVSSDNTPLSLNQLGIITSSVSGGNLILSYENNGSSQLKLKSKIIGIGTTGVADGTYRFKSLNQEDGSERTSLYSGVSTSNVGVSTLTTLNSLLFNAVKSNVEVSIGSSKAIHEVLFLHDGTNAYSQQSGSLSVTKDETSEYDSSSGLGTFGAKLSGNNFSIEFFPDDVVGVTTVVSLNQCFYTKMDTVNVPENLNYGVISESNSVVLYNSISGNRIQKTQFTPKTNSVPIFGKSFNPSDSSVLNQGTGKFTIPNHFFRNNEELVYEPKSTFVGVGSTALQYKLSGVGIHTLPSTVFVVNAQNDTFFISTTKAGTAVTFMSPGEGNAHEFSMSKSNEKALIVIDDVAQYPLIRTDVTHTLDSNLGSQIGLTTDIVHLSGISTISVTDILKVDDELMEVVNVGFATTGGGAVGTSGTFKSIKVNRSFVGTSPAIHSDGTTVSRFRGSYNIVGKDLFFTKPPRGDVTKTKDINDLDIATSKFSGRVYLRNNYDSNAIYDDVSDQFTGVTSSFTLKVGGANTIGIGSTGGSGILFINGIFQSPSTDLNPNKNFKIIESGSGATGVTTVIFTGITSSNGDVFTSNNINTNELPRGGIPISIGNTQNGLGYAPLVPAVVKPLVNVGGSITDIVGVAFSGSDLIVENAVYNGSTGIMSIRTKNEHRFKNSNDFVLIDNIGFSPSLTLKKSEFQVVSVGATNIFGISVGKTDTTFNYTGSGDAYPFFPNLTFGSGYNDIVSIGVTVQDLGYEHRFISAATNAINVTGGSQLTPTNVSYASTNGLLILTVLNHGLTNSNTITIDDASLSFSCSRDNFETIHVYPRSTDPASVNTSALNNGVLPVTKIDDNTFSVNVGVNVGTGATVTASVGVGGTLAFTIVGGGGTDYQDPQIFVSEPSYSNLQVRGISRRGIGNTTTTGTDLRVNAIVKPVTGIGSTLFEISEYEIVNRGFAFEEGDVIEPVGLVTERGLSNLLERSTLTVEKTFNDAFALWQFGEFDYIDSIKNLQDGERSSFQLFVNNQLVSVELNDSLQPSVKIEDIFLVVVNGVIQEPQSNYTIIGGNLISFAEPLLEDDDVTILFYKGTTNDDSIVNLAQTLSIEPGDEVQISGVGTVKEQDKRTVFNLNTSKKLETNVYFGKGLNDNVLRPLSLIKQKEDKVINKVLVSKKRRSIEPRITPVAKVISDLSTSDTTLFVDSTDIFNYEGDNDPSLEFTLSKTNQIDFIKAEATAIVSASGTVTGFSTSNFGSGYTIAPTVKLSAPPVTIQSGLGTINAGNPLVGVGTTATATATIGAGGTITSIVPNNAGLGYSQTNPPQVLISSPFTYSNTFENLRTASGDTLGIQTNTGRISGIGVTTFSGKLGIKFDIRGDNTSTFKPIAVGNPIYVFDTRCGSGLTSINTSGVDSDTVGIGVSFADNIYVVAGIHTVSAGVGVITCLIQSTTTTTGLSSIGSAISPVGKYSVGKISGFTRGSNPISIGVTGNTVGVTTGVGISTFPTIKRIGGGETFDQTGSLQPE